MAEGVTDLKEEDLEAIKLPKTYLGGGLSPKQLDALLDRPLETLTELLVSCSLFVSRLKLEKAPAETIVKETATLNNLIAVYKQATGTDWKPPQMEQGEDTDSSKYEDLDERDEAEVKPTGTKKKTGKSPHTKVKKGKRSTDRVKFESTMNSESEDEKTIPTKFGETSPLVKLFPPTRAEMTQILSDEEPEIHKIPKNPTQRDFEQRDRDLLVKSLKQKRTISYRSITRMAKCIEKERDDQTLDYWKDLLAKALEEGDKIREITEKVNRLDPNIRVSEKEKVNQYLALLTSSARKIQDYIEDMEKSFLTSMDFAKASLAKGKAMTDPSEIQRNLMLEYTRVTWSSQT